jgi:hypothetical protein
VNQRFGAIVAPLLAAAFSVAALGGVAAATAAAPGLATASWVSPPPVTPVEPPARPEEIGAVLGGTPDEIRGIGSNYPGTAGWLGEATVALPGPLGGQYSGEVNGFVTVCADRCARLPIVDWCECYWSTGDRRVVDLSHAAWALVSDQPLETGLIEVRLRLEG